MARYFTHEEAEALLPAISVVLREIQEARQQIREVQEELETLRVRSIGNGHNLQKRSTILQQHLVAHVEALRALMERLQEFGCELKDPDSGLIDFLSLRDGQEVYLCWLLGEDRIGYWHYLHTGFAGRQPL